MEEKELKINIPEGYEIDKENSTFEIIKFKPIPLIKNLTYKEVTDNLFENCSIDIAISYKDLKEGNLNNITQAIKSEATYSKKQYDKILAINQLFNIAKYYNGDLEPNWNCLKETWYNIVKIKGYYTVYDCDSINIGMPIFKNKKDAQAVINNTNFQDILDTIFK